MNKIYVSEYKGESMIGTSYFMIVIAASSIDVAKKKIKFQIGFDVQPTWLMGATYPTIYDQTGNNPLPVQAKILFNGNCHYRK